MTESEKDAQARWILKRDEPVCSCKPENPRHKETWQCVTAEVVYAFLDREACHFQNLNDVKRAASMWLHFSQDPEAKRLSGRVSSPTRQEVLDQLKTIPNDALGLDTWDDAAGMSELEKRMFE